MVSGRCFVLLFFWNDSNHRPSPCGETMVRLPPHQQCRHQQQCCQTATRAESRIRSKVQHVHSAGSHLSSQPHTRVQTCIQPYTTGIVQVGRKLWNPKAWMLSH